MTSTRPGAPGAGRFSEGKAASVAVERAAVLRGIRKGSAPGVKKVQALVRAELELAHDGPARPLEDEAAVLHLIKARLDAVLALERGRVAAVVVERKLRLGRGVGEREERTGPVALESGGRAGGLGARRRGEVRREACSWRGLSFLMILLDFWLRKRSRRPAGSKARAAAALPDIRTTIAADPAPNLKRPRLRALRLPQPLAPRAPRRGVP